MLAEFEEKEVEGALNAQLSGRLWSPGQVLEYFVGFDAALDIESSLHWSLLGYTTPPVGTTISVLWWSSPAAQAALSQRPPPPFRLNLFLQYKRPEYLRSPTAVEWPHWNAPYFRFNIVAHQQSALDSCAAGL